MSTTRVMQIVRASRHDVYCALLDRDAVQRWLVPDGMTSTVHVFEAREGGRFRITLTYDEPTGTGKSTSHSDTFYGRFTRLVPDRTVVEVVAFETDDSSMQGEMTMTYALADVDGGTELTLTHEGVPEGVRPEDNEVGTRMSLANLARLVENDQPRQR